MPSCNGIIFQACDSDFLLHLPKTRVLVKYAIYWASRGTRRKCFLTLCMNSREACSGRLSSCGRDVLTGLKQEWLKCGNLSLRIIPGLGVSSTKWIISAWWLLCNTGH